MLHRLTARWARAAVLGALIAASAAAGDFVGEILANSDVVGLVRANVSEDIVIAKIRGTPNIFNLSTRDLVSLKENGVSDNIIRAMQAAMDGTAAPQPIQDATRVRLELENIASGVPEAKNASMAWMVANSGQSLPILRQALTDSRPELRAAAISVLGGIGDRDSVPAIRNLLTDASPLVRQATAKALVDLNDVSALTAADQALARQPSPLDGYVRLVGYSRSTQSAGVLGRILETNAEPLNRVAAAWALGEIGRAGTDGRPALENALAADSDPAVRREAASALAKFHDSRSAQVLQEACARDWQVRKTILGALSEYPEAVEFLVWVMTLTPEQIAADEMEAARASLVRLTGQDFGQDGQRWSEWYAANRSRFPSSSSILASSAPAAPPAPMAALPEPSLPSRRSEVDVEAWSIVADSAGIPMAPAVDDRPSAAPGGALPLPPPSAGTGSSAPAWGGSSIPVWSGAASSTPAGSALPLPPPGFSSASGLVSPSAAATAGLPSAAVFKPAGLSNTPDVPVDIPGIGDLDPATVGAMPETTLRTWSSDPARVPGSTQPAQAAPRTSAPAPGAAPSELFRGGSDMRASIPPSPVAQPVMSPPAPEPSASLGGLSLPLPPLGGASDSSGAPSYQQPVYEQPVFPSGGEPEPMRRDLFADPYGSGTPSPFDALPTPDAIASPALSDPWQSIEMQSPAGRPEEADLWQSLVTPSPAPAAASDGDAYPVPQWQPVATPIPEAVPVPFAETPPSAPAFGFEDPWASQSGAAPFDANPLETGALPPSPAAMPPPSSGRFDMPDSFSPDPYGASGTLPDASSGLTLPMPPVGEVEAQSGVIFVEPEPGQVVVGEPLLGYESVPPLAGSAADSLPPSPETWAVVEGGAGASPATPSTADDLFFSDPYLEAGQPVVPASPAQTSEPAPIILPPPSSGVPETFVEPSTPLPPVRPEGTVLPPRGKELPPTLGETL